MEPLIPKRLRVLGGSIGFGAIFAIVLSLKFGWHVSYLTPLIGAVVGLTLWLVLLRHFFDKDGNY